VQIISLAAEYRVDYSRIIPISLASVVKYIVGKEYSTRGNDLDRFHIGIYIVCFVFVLLHCLVPQRVLILKFHCDREIGNLLFLKTNENPKKWGKLKFCYTKSLSQLNLFLQMKMVLQSSIKSSGMVCAHIAYLISKYTAHDYYEAVPKRSKVIYFSLILLHK
jgi:hypothetical protein